MGLRFIKLLCHSGWYYFKLMSSFQTQRNPFLMIATMASTLPCCWLVSAFYCHTIVSSPMWTTSTANSKVWCNQLVAHHRNDKIKFPKLWVDKWQLCIAQSKYLSSSYACQFPSLPLSGTSIVFDMSLTYILVALSAVIVNNALVERLSLHTRICVGENMQKVTSKYNNERHHFLHAHYITLIYRLQYH